ncbi:hypothetical protein GCM10011611_11530 [Aliidongia dinghuensis]|uniref:DUF1501 domain-containing protein n=1 Tax=Aliidongia dinghuensis TaxID=1867774 RepID=A0A8J2YQL3_9PROT|nr:DUF1501 domain-containing protein [Aliidongia dinghuensis]GGF07725.1 hypothetical protein GCM10011611_11530 [Aliidongia dinghuensis]
MLSHPTRRSILGGGLAGLAAGLLPVPGLRNLAFGGTGPDRPLLVVVHLRGGCDGLNLISPATDPEFIDARASELRVAVDGPDAGHALANGPDPKIDFRLHPQAAGLAELYKGGQLAFLHAVGLTDGTRSHFVATDMIERGVADAAALNRQNDGWLTRALGTDGAARGLVAASASGTISGELLGLPSAIAVPGLDGGLAPPGGPQAAEVLKRLYAFAQGDVGIAGRDALGAMATIDGRLSRDPQGHIQPYQAEAHVDYGPAADFGRPLKTLAQLIKMDIGLEAATVDIGGWDTHEYQPGRFKAAVDHLSNGIAQFWNDMARYHDRMILVTLTEFGRRLRSNKSQGTDHGRAGVMAVLGGKVHGGRFYGAWPGMTPDRLDEGVDLAVATDYRRVLTEVLEAREGRRLPSVFQGYSYPGALGLFGAAPGKA